MNDKQNEIDSLLSEALQRDDLYEEPSDELIQRLEKQIADTQKPVTTRRAFKLSTAIAIAILASLSLSMVAFGGAILEALGFRIVEGEEYVISYGIGEGWAIIETSPVGGRVVVETDGELWVVQDPLILTDLDEAIELFARPEHLKLPTYLPEGFEFYQAVFPLSPVHHPDIDSARYHLDIIFSNGEEFFHFHTSITSMATAYDDPPITFVEDWDESSSIEIPEHGEGSSTIEIVEDWPPEYWDESPTIEIAQDWLDEDLVESPILEVTVEEEGILSPPPLILPPSAIDSHYCTCEWRPYDSPSDGFLCEHCTYLEGSLVTIPAELVIPENIQEIVLSNGRRAWLYNHVFMIDTECIESRKVIAYVFSFHSHPSRPGADLDRETLIRMAESLEYVNP